MFFCQGLCCVIWFLRVVVLFPVRIWLFVVFAHDTVLFLLHTLFLVFLVATFSPCSILVFCALLCAFKDVRDLCSADDSFMTAFKFCYCVCFCLRITMGILFCVICFFNSTVLIFCNLLFVQIVQILLVAVVLLSHTVPAHSFAHLGCLVRSLFGSIWHYCGRSFFCPCPHADACIAPSFLFAFNSVCLVQICFGCA